jgi:hypothetical protein
MYIERVNRQYNSDKECVLKQLGNTSNNDISSSTLVDLITEYATERQIRTDKFIHFIIKQRQDYVEHLYPL